MKPPSNGAGTKIRDLISLVANEAADSHKILEKWFDWQHSRALEVAKWSLAAASGLIAAVFVASAKQAQPAAPSLPGLAAPGAPDGWHAVLVLIANWSMAIALVAGVLLVIGVTAMQSAKKTQREYVVAQGLLARLKTIAPFLKRASEQSDIRA
jgi:hypothetical protein